jgi:hypothetical protein
MTTSFLLRFQEALREGGDGQPVGGLGRVRHANTETTVTEVSGEQPRRDPKKMSGGVFPNQPEE